MIGGLTATVVNVSVSFLQFSILLRRLPLEVAGIWMIFTNLGSYVMFFDMGLTPTLGREVSFAAANPNLSEVEREQRIGTLIRSCTSVATVLAGFVIFLGGTVGWSYLHTIIPPALTPSVKPAWAVFILGAALNLVGEGWFAGIYGLGQVLNEKLIRSCGALLGLLFLTIAVYFKTGFMGLACAYLAQSTFCILAARFWLSKATSGSTSTGRFDILIIRALVGPSIKYAATLLGGILILQTDNLVIASTLGPRLVPNYQAIAKMVTILMGLSMMLVTTSAPLQSQAHSKKDSIEFLSLLNRNLRFSLSTMIILGTFIACFADRVISLWLGPNHFVGFYVVWALLGVMLFEAHAQALAAAVMSTGKIVFWKSTLLAGLLNISLSIPLARRYGLVGVVLGTLLAQILTNHWYVPWYAMHQFAIRPRDHMRNVIMPLAGLIVLVAGTGIWLRILTQPFQIFYGIATGAIGTTVVGVLCFGILILNSDERKSLKTRLSAMAWKGESVSPIDTLP
jgi:O-antigen/teichoic acid export membrane protein